MDSVNHIKLRVERHTAQPILTALLSAIFFHRTLDNIEPSTLDILDTHVAVSSPPAAVLSGRDGGVEREIAAAVGELVRTVETGRESAEIAVVFFQRKNKKGWFAVTEAMVPWEEHLITLTFVTRATLNPLPGALLQVLTFCAKHKNNVPALVGTGDQSNVAHQILLFPPSPAELFDPSFPSGPASPPPPSDAARPASSYPTRSAGPNMGARGIAQAAAEAARRPSTPMNALTDAGTSAMGYLGQAKEMLGGLGAKGRRY